MIQIFTCSQRSWKAATLSTQQNVASPGQPQFSLKYQHPRSSNSLDAAKYFGIITSHFFGPFVILQNIFALDQLIWSFNILMLIYVQVILYSWQQSGAFLFLGLFSIFCTCGSLAAVVCLCCWNKVNYSLSTSFFIIRVENFLKTLHKSIIFSSSFKTPLENVTYFSTC